MLLSGRQPGTLRRALGLSWFPMLAGRLCDHGCITLPLWLTVLLPLTSWDSEEWALWLSGSESGDSLALSLLTGFAQPL